MSEMSYWYALYTKPRWEKKVYSLLIQRGFEAYCPLNKVRKEWSDRTKWIEEPLFKSYVFVRIPEKEQIKVRMVGGVVNFVYWLGRPAMLKDKEIQTIRDFLKDHTDVTVEPIGLKKEDKVTIRKGILMTREGKVLQVLNNKVRVVIDSIGYALVAILDKSNVKVLERQSVKI